MAAVIAAAVAAAATAAETDTSWAQVIVAIVAIVVSLGATLGTVLWRLGRNETAAAGERKVIAVRLDSMATSLEHVAENVEQGLAEARNERDRLRREHAETARRVERIEATCAANHRAPSCPKLEACDEPNGPKAVVE